jgi:hypothetical protein
VHDAAVGGFEVRLVGREQAADEAETALGGTVEGAQGGDVGDRREGDGTERVLQVVAVTEPTPELGSGLSTVVDTTLMGALCQVGVRIVFRS